MSARLKAVRMVWKDLVDEQTRKYLDSHTCCELEDKLRARMSDWMPVFRVTVEVFREHGLSTDSVMESAAKKIGSEIAVDAYFVAAERGQRVGEQRARNMILESHAYSDNLIRRDAPWLTDDAVDDDEDEPAPKPTQSC